MAGVVVADVGHDLADDRLHVDVGARRDLTKNEDEAGGRGCLAGDAGIRIFSEDRVKHRVRDLVADLVRMALCHRLGGEQKV